MRGIINLSDSIVMFIKSIIKWEDYANVVINKLKDLSFKYLKIFVKEGYPSSIVGALS
jgi:uncharacterized protein (DUF3820 family)